MPLRIVLDQPNTGANQRVYNTLNRLETNASNPEPAFQAIHVSFLAMEKARFSGSNDWKPLTAKYLAWKVSHGHDHHIMRRYGELHRALTTGVGPGAITDITPWEAVFGTNIHYAVYAQRGKGTRRRKVIVVTRARRSKWAQIMLRHLTGQPI
jgi:phage gpG-like protein